MGTPVAFYNNAVDLNRYSNKVARQVITTYNDVILDAVGQLQGLDEMSAPMRAARLRGILRDMKQSIDGWAGDATALSVKELQGLAELQGEFVQEQLKKALPASARDQVRSVQISQNFAQSVAVTDPTAINVVALSDDLQAAVTGAPATFRLDAAKGATITLPNGKVLEKAFRGIASDNAEMFARVVRTGLVQGKSIDRISRELRGRVRFGQPGSAREIARYGGDATKMANHQLLTLVRTSVNQVANAASQANYQANQNVTKKYKYTATLDNRTSPICRSLDGKEFEYGKGPTPPQHFNCRSTTVPVIDYKGLKLEPPPRADVIPDRKTYGEWLADQSKERKASILGSERRAEIFDKFTKKVGPKEAIRRFVREDGSELDLAGLERRLERTKAKPVASVTPKPKPKPKPVASTPKPVAKAAPAAPKPTSKAPPKPKFRSADTNYDYDKNWEKLGYKNKAAYRKVRSDVVEWSGNEFEGVRAAQFANAKKAGRDLNDYELLQTRRLEKGEARSYSKMAERLEDFVQRAPKYDGTLRRGVALDRPEEVRDLIERYSKGEKGKALESWTSSKGVSDRFAWGNADVRSQRVSILVEDNRVGAPINAISGFNDEYEVLVPSGVRYEVLEVQEKFVKGRKGASPVDAMDHTDWVIKLRQIVD